MAQSAPLARSCAPAQRIHYLDALRAFALAGIILVHFVSQFGIFTEPAFDQRHTTVVDTWTFKMTTFFLVGKMYTIFSLLFGVSFSISQERMASDPNSFARRFGWRTLLLFGFAVTHNLYYSGDFLVTYALLSPILLSGSRFGNRILLTSSVFLLSHPFQLMMIILQVISPADYPSSGIIYHTIPNPSDYLEASWATSMLTVFASRWNEGFITQTAGLFYLGLFLGRRKVLLSNDAAKWILYLAFFLLSAGVLYATRRHMEALALSESLTASSDRYLNHLFCFIMAGAYISLLKVLWMQFGIIHAILKKLATFGRMSLTHYMLHSAIGVFVFGPAGLGLAGNIGFATSAALGLWLMIIQWVLSQIWSRYYRHGPLEGLWRIATFKLYKLSLRK